MADLKFGEGVVTVINDPEEFIAGVRQSSAARSAELDWKALKKVKKAKLKLMALEPEVIAKGKEEEDE